MRSFTLHLLRAMWCGPIGDAPDPWPADMTGRIVFSEPRGRWAVAVCWPPGDKTDLALVTERAFNALRTAINNAVWNHAPIAEIEAYLKRKSKELQTGNT